MILQKLVTRRRMLLDHGAFVGVEAAGLVEDRKRDLRLADVVEHGCGIQPLEIGSSDAEAQSEVDRHAGHEQAMLVGSLMVTPHRGKPFGQAVLGDAVGDPAARFLRAVDVEGLAERDGREHRSDGGRRGFDGVVRLGCVT